MDCKLVSDSRSAHLGGERESSPPLFTYTERFYEQFPYYLAMGMTPEQFWDGEPSLVVHYRKAEEIRREKMNFEKWLQGMYIYEAFADVSPILHAFAKKGTKPHPYPDKPYALNEKQKEFNQSVKEKAVSDKGKRIMEAFMKSHNKKFEKPAQE